MSSRLKAVPHGIIGVTKAIREQLGKRDGDALHIVIEER